MGNFTFSEILTIVIVILIIFGPDRLPELSRKAGALVARARRSFAALRAEFTEEYRDAIGPIVEARDELRATGRELRGDLDAVRSDVEKARSETARAAGSVVPGSDGEERSAEEPEQERDTVVAGDGGAEPVTETPADETQLRRPSTLPPMDEPQSPSSSEELVQRAKEAAIAGGDDDPGEPGEDAPPTSLRSVGASEVVAEPAPDAAPGDPEEAGDAEEIA
jgi:sec-independent protein translocase protein TatB